MNFEIRPAAAADIPDIIALLGEFAEFERLAHEFAVTEKALREAIFGDEAFVKCLVARAAGEIAAFAIFFPVFKTFRGERSLYLEDLYVRPPFRGAGLGLRMLKEIARFARENGFARMDWQALAWNEKAINFYNNLGAESSGENLDFRLVGENFNDLAS